MKLKSHWRNYQALWLCLLAGVLLTGLLHLWLAGEIRRDLQQVLDARAHVVAQQLEGRLRLQAELLRGLQGAFAANPNLDRQQFGQLLNQLNVEQRYPGFVTMSFVRAVPRADLAGFEARVQPTLAGSRYPPFRLTPANPAGDMLYITDYVYPVNNATTQYFGLDVGSLPASREAIEYARDYNQGVMTRPYMLVGLPEQSLGYVLRYPVYQPDQPLASVAARRRAFIGTIGVVFRVADVVSWVDPKLREQVQLALWDQGRFLGHNSADGALRLYPPGDLAPAAARYTATELIDLPGRQWRLALGSEQGIYADRYMGIWRMLWLLGIGLALGVGVILQRQRNARDMALSIADEITEDLRAQQNLQRRLVQVAEAAQDVIVSRDVHGRIVYANRAAREAFAAQNRPLLGHTEPLFTSAELASTDKPLMLEGQLHEPGGEQRHYDLRIVPLQDSNERPDGSALFAHDVSGHHRLEVQAKTNDARFTDLIELANGWFWEQDAQYRFTFISGSFLRRLGVDANRLLGKTRWDLGQGGISEQEWFDFRQRVAQHQPFQDFCYLLELGRTPILVSVSGKPIFDEQGVFIGYRGVGHDVTAIRAAELMVRSEKQRIESILDSIGDGVITTDMAGKIEYLNPVASALIGWQPEEALGRPLSRIFQTVDEDTGLPSEPLPQPILDGTTLDGALQRRSVLLNKFGLSLVIQESSMPLRDVNANIVGAVLVFRDVSDWWARVTHEASGGEH
ncbi:PAS domain S-box-containing protein [Andreprevotia lacus DSM 23236]|jgi:PAS domain S-box-containing protein|uniref:PAS domain S-box-containing protein n=1 Tax=Andreprevotia lacus DSM 23236 TaxID=1121001 RepID=A0A1W1XUX3_9NEIS|nr:CHASE domain-containing protein [Andreprevotia lacus]SMC27328.1 PAS domain S-box-containing protein [Andreprevotia lacus DSM 23236]